MLVCWPYYPLAVDILLLLLWSWHTTCSNCSFFWFTHRNNYEIIYIRNCFCFVFMLFLWFKDNIELQGKTNIFRESYIYDLRVFGVFKGFAAVLRSLPVPHTVSVQVIKWMKYDCQLIRKIISLHFVKSRSLEIVLYKNLIKSGKINDKVEWKYSF